MFSIKPLPEFTEWLDGLSDVSVRGVVARQGTGCAAGLTEGDDHDPTHQGGRPA